MVMQRCIKKERILIIAAFLMLLQGSFCLLSAKDTDIYNVSTKQNCYILLDRSGSMAYGVYEQSIDYGDMFDYLFTLNDSGSFNDYIYDTINNSNYFYQNHQERRKIFLWKGRIGVTFATPDGETVTFTGDAANPDYLWFMSQLIDTHTVIDSDGNLADDGSGNQRLTIDGDGYVLLDGIQLPLDKSKKLHEYVTLYDGSQLDNGFGGLLNAPGYYFSGYEGVTAGSLNVAEDGDQDIFFFVTGNWVNMQAMYNLHYTTNNPAPAGASRNDAAWRYELFPIATSAWSELPHTTRYPDSGQYANRLAETATVRTITHPGATQIQIHFTSFDVQGNSNAGSFTKDYVALYDAAGTLIEKFDNDNNPTSGDGWSSTIYDDTVQIKLSSNRNTRGDGYIVDKIRVTYQTDSYLMQDRMGVAKDSLLYVLDEFVGKMNWGYATYNYTGGGSGDGATINSALNPTVNDDVNRAAIKRHVEGTDTGGGTPLGEALQDVFEKGYWTKRHSLDNIGCAKNYIISLTDGFPSTDDEWDRITDANSDTAHLPITDLDGDNWTADPYQYNNPPDNYYDDVAHYLYTHSWKTKNEVTSPADSYDNVRTHHVAFGMDHPMLEDAAGESGGQYIAAFNKTQLVAAFYALTLMMTEAISFTSPVVSVDADNKIQNGDDFYLGLFLPQDAQMWVGNLKKFRLGDGSTARPDVWMIYDGGDNAAIDSDGNFLDNTTAFWADDSDANDSDNYGSADVKEDGVGEILTEKVADNFATGNYWNRPIYTYDEGNTPNIKDFDRNITALELDVADDLTKDKIVNFVFGYTNDADAATGAPTGVGEWALGSIIHSRPVVIDYYDPNDLSVLLNRYIAIGSNDGMLHIFDDANGQEVFSFIPQDLLPKLKLLPDTPIVDMVDGLITLYRSNKQPKYLIFGERKGGKAFWCLNVTEQDPTNWTVQWTFANAEIAQSWSEPILATMPVSINGTTGERTFKDVLILTGGYDPEEDDYPEPFSDLDNSGSPYKDTGGIDTSEWDKNDNDHDVNGNNDYDEYNKGMNGYGRAIYVLDIEDPDNITLVDGKQILPFSVTYGAAPEVTSGATQTRTSMKWCFPGSPSVVTESYNYVYKDTDGDLVQVRKSNVLKWLYAIDIYANLYRVNYDFEVSSDDPNAGSYSITKNDWDVSLIFSGNPGSLSAGGAMGGGEDPDDQGRKTFFPPVVSAGGSCDYFDAGNFRFSEVDFFGLSEIATLFFGTGDREHPSYTMIRDRFYAVYDDSSITAQDAHTTADITITSIPYTEDYLVNLSCNELDDGVDLAAGLEKSDIQELLTDDAIYKPGEDIYMENGGAENDAKGWYIIFEDQGDTTACSHCTYAAADADDDHDNEKSLSRAALYAGVLYFTTYQPATTDPCTPQGNGFAYSLNYCDGTAAYNLNQNNDSTDENFHDVTDRYGKQTGLHGVPSDFSIVTRKGQAGAMSMMGGKVVGPREGDEDGEDFKIKSPGWGLELYYWRESDSQAD